MIYLRIRETTKLAPGGTLRLGDIADVLADASLRLNELPVQAPTRVGIWRMDAMEVIRDIQKRFPAESVVLLGSSQGILILEKPKEHRLSWLRATLVFALLFVGSAMAIAWFHADVNMTGAQHTVAAWLTGRQVTNAWWVALPYALGVGSGVAFYYALIGRKTASPLDMKLTEYRRQTMDRMARTGEEQPRG